MYTHSVIHTQYMHYIHMQYTHYFTVLWLLWFVLWIGQLKILAGKSGIADSVTANFIPMFILHILLILFLADKNSNASTVVQTSTVVGITI